MNFKKLALPCFGCLLGIFFICPLKTSGQKILPGVKKTTVGEAWSKNSVNAVIFRKNSLTSLGKWQFIAFYDNESRVVLGKRKIGDKKWSLQTTNFKGNTADAHNCISIMVDGSGFLHVAWDHHANRLHYARSKSPYSLELTAEMPMTGVAEEQVTYPEFFRMPDGNLIFFYRDGKSGGGNLVLNQYNRQTKTWKTLHGNLVSGEGARNAYPQACVDTKGIIHLSWVWRESPDVSSNHDLAYARSMDGGLTWQQSTGKPYALPITDSTAEYAARVPQKSELINQTSMTADEKGNPMIATYWKTQGDSVPQYRVVYLENNAWKVLNTGFRTTAFTLNGVGSKFIPISRPQIIAYRQGEKSFPLLIFRDAERGFCASLGYYNGAGWNVMDFDTLSLGAWEPSFDTNLWAAKKQLNLFVQPVVQIDREGLSENLPTKVEVWQWKPGKLF